MMDSFYLTQADLLRPPPPKDHEDHLPRYQGPLGEDLQQGTMDGYSFHADYLGFTTIAKPPTALNIIQPPVKDLYIKSRKPGGETNIKKVILRVIPGGLIFTFLESTQRGEVFFDINAMIYFEGLKFQIVGSNDKKPHALFVPLDESKLTPKDHKSAFVLDKSIQFLAQAQHPPLLTCVLRRPKGIKALDCHLFIFETLNDVHQITSLLAGVQAGGGKLPEISDFRQTETKINKGQKGDIIRTEYGDYAIYRGNQMELKDDFFRPRDENGAFEDRRDERREDRRSDRRDDRSDDRREEDKKAYDWDYDSSPIDNAWRSVQKQFTNEVESEHRRHEPDRPDNQFVAHSRDRSGDSNEGRFAGRNMSDSDRGRYDDRQYRASPHLNPRDKVPPPVAEKPSSPRPLSPHGQRFPGGQYGGPPPRDDPRANQYNPRDDPRANQYNPRYAPSSGGPVFSASNLEGRRDRNSKDDEEMPPKPIAKVPPHLVAGIKVLPTNFNPQGVKLKPRSPNTEKLVEKSVEKTFSSDGSDDHEYDNVLQKLDQMISDNSSEHSFQRKQPTQHDREVYDQNIRKNWTNEDPRYNRESPRPERGHYGPATDYCRYEGPDDRRPMDGGDDRRYMDGGDDRRYIEQYEYQKRNIDARPDYPEDPRNEPKSNRYSLPPMYDRGERSHESPNRWSGSNKSQSSYEMSGRSPGLPQGGTPENPDHNNRKKDAEIANMFVGHPRDRGEAHNQYRPMPAETNFEQSLGYYP